MTTISGESVVTAAQLAVFASHVNDKRVISETRELAERAGVNPDLVNKIRYLPPDPPRLARVIFTVFTVDAEGARLRVFDDGEPYDEELAAAGKRWHYLLEEQEFKFRAEMPVWWAQAARTVVPELEEST